MKITKYERLRLKKYLEETTIEIKDKRIKKLLEKESQLAELQRFIDEQLEYSKRVAMTTYHYDHKCLAVERIKVYEKIKEILEQK